MPKRAVKKTTAAEKKKKQQPKKRTKRATEAAPPPRPAASEKASAELLYFNMVTAERAPGKRRVKARDWVAAESSDSDDAGSRGADSDRDVAPEDLPPSSDSD